MEIKSQIQMLLEYFLLFLSLWNLITFFMMGLDKFYAIKGLRRIPEKTLLLSALFLGGLGLFSGMYFFHHKTKHKKFKIGLPLILIFNIATILFIISKFK